MQRFRCLAQDCEDNCCKRWSVRLDEEHYQRILTLGTGHSGLQALIDKAVQITTTPQDAHHYASISMDAEGYCPFLTDTALCQLQQHGGIDVLGNTCANYPRVYYQIDEVLEFTGALSCPEVTRLCFSNDASPGLREVEASLLPRTDYTLTHHIDSQHAPYYERLFPRIRKELLRVAYQPLYTAKQKLYLLCYLSQRLSEQYNNDCGEESLEFVSNEIQRFSGTEIRHNLLAGLAKYTDQEKTGLITIQSIFSIRIQHYQQEPLTPYIDDIIRSYRSELPFEMDIDRLFEIYHQRKAIILDAARSQIEEYLTRHLQNCLLREWYIRFPDPFAYMQMLVVRQAMLRFLLYSHPAIFRWCESEFEHDPAILHKVIEELAVEIFYLFSRSIEHDIPFLQNIYSALITENMMELETTRALLRGL